MNNAAMLMQQQQQQMRPPAPTMTPSPQTTMQTSLRQLPKEEQDFINENLAAMQSGILTPQQFLERLRARLRPEIFQQIVTASRSSPGLDTCYVDCLSLNTKLFNNLSSVNAI